MAWKNLRKWLGIMAIGAGALLMPRENFGEVIQISNYDGISGNGISGSTINLDKFSNSQELQDDNDISWEDFLNEFPPLDNNWLKVSTQPYGVALQTDGRSLESETIYSSNLSAITDALSLTVTNKIRFLLPDGEDSTRHYTAKIHCNTNYTPNNDSFDKTVNIREVIANDSGIVNLPGIVNCPDGTVYGTVDVSPAFNKLVSTSTTGGTNNPIGEQILNYGTNKTVALNANPGYYVDYYVLARTDNTGSVNVVTNNFIGTDVTSTNIPIDNLKGSNSIYAVYATNAPSTFAVDIQDGAKYGLNPTNFTGVASGGSITSTAANIYYTNSAGIRNKITGLKKK